MSLIAALTLVAATTHAQTGFGFDRVDIVSEDPGIWLHYDAPMLGMNAATSAVRLLEQVKPVWTLPVKGLYLGTSISSQSLVYEHALLPKQGLFVTGGLQTRLLMPRGALAGVAWRFGRFRLGVSLSALSTSSWARPNWSTWSFLPTFGFGVGSVYRPEVAAPAP